MLDEAREYTEEEKQELKRLAELLHPECKPKSKPKSKFDEAIEKALERLNRAIREYKKPKYPIYPTRIAHTSGWQRKKAWK